MKVLICGSRNFPSEATVAIFMNRLLGDYDITEVIEGEAAGADTFGRMWAESWRLPVRKFRAKWNKYGKAAGPIRNKEMLTEGQPDLVVAFLTGKLSESRGTLDMVQQARAAGVKVIIGAGVDDVPFQYTIEELPS